jgi:hypothetical protein
MFDKDLLVLEEFDPSKTMEDYSFTTIPIWIRVHKMPLGMMSRKNGVLIGDRVGEFMEMDGVEDGMAVGKYLRIKVRLDITTPLMRGTMMEVDDVGRIIWCPFEYEFLPDFCYVCGIIGHVEKECNTKLKKGDEPQFGRWLRWLPPKKAGVEGRRFWNDNRGRRSFGWGGQSVSDDRSWRKDKTETLHSGKATEGAGKRIPRPLQLEGGGASGSSDKLRVGSDAKKQLISAQEVESGVVGVEDDGNISLSKVVVSAGKAPIVGDIPNRYTSDVVLNQQARVAHQGWYGGFAIPGGPVAEASTAVLDAGAYGGYLDRSMADH